MLAGSAHAHMSTNVSAALKGVKGPVPLFFLIPRPPANPFSGPLSWSAEAREQTFQLQVSLAPIVGLCDGNSLVPQLVRDGEGQVEAVVLGQHALPPGAANAAQVRHTLTRKRPAPVSHMPVSHMLTTRHVGQKDGRDQRQRQQRKTLRETQKDIKHNPPTPPKSTRLTKRAPKLAKRHGDASVCVCVCV